MKKKLLDEVQEGDILTRHTNARYEVDATLWIEGKKYVVYHHIKTSGRPKINTISHLKSWQYYIEVNK